MVTERLTVIRKRNGELVSFDEGKIRNAIRLANDAVGDEFLDGCELDDLTRKVVLELGGERVPTVEEVQDVVEQELVGANLPKTAKAYILYRAEHAKVRQAEGDLMDIYKQLTFEDAKDVDLKRENANIDADTAMGTMLKYGSEGSKYFTNNYVLPRDLAWAHMNGDIHIHDQDFYMLTETCCQIDLLKLFAGGFSTGHGNLREPNSIDSYAALACIAIQANQNEMHGGQSIPNFDYSMAPGVAKTFAKSYRNELARYWQVFVGGSFEEALGVLDGVFQVLGPIRMSEMDAYGERLETQLGGGGFGLDVKKAHEFALEGALRDTERKTFQAMEALIHNLNTMNSRAGAQVPFSSVNYGTDMTPEGRMVVRNLLFATEAGLGEGETPIFPVQIFKVKDGVNYREGDPNYDLFKLAIRCSAKRLFPNFSFLDAPFNLEYYRAGDYDSEVSYMGCRTRVLGNVYDRTRETTCGRGNLSFTSINLPRIGLEAAGGAGGEAEVDAAALAKRLERFYEILDERMALVVRQLLHRFGIQSSKRVRNYPFLMGQGIWIDSEKLGPDDSIAEVLKHGSLSVGFIGLAECLVALCGRHHGESEESQRLGLEIISHMRRRMDAEAEKHGLNFTLLATPAEGLSGRFVKMDRRVYGSIPGVTDREYYTNSFHVPVHFAIGAFRKIRIEAPYHALTNAGHISYVELDGDASENLEAFETIIRCMKESGIGYGSVNHPVDRDPVCGYNGIIQNVCPKCGRVEGGCVGAGGATGAGAGSDGSGGAGSDGSGGAGSGAGEFDGDGAGSAVGLAGAGLDGAGAGVKFERIRRITGYLVGTTDRWNNAKYAEERDRVKHGL